MNKFISFINPLLQSIDKGTFFGKPFRWLYLAFATVNLLLPIVILFKAIDNHIFDMPFKYGLTFSLLWLCIVFASWLGFQIWYNRGNQLDKASSTSADFVATPVMAHLIQTTGEWVGTWLAVVGTSFSLIASVILGNEASSLAYQLNLSFLSGGFVLVFVFPVAGYLIIVFSRFFSEQVKALAAIANNTKK